MKKYYDAWSADEVDEYVEEFGILVLFKIHERSKEAEIIIHGNLSTHMKESIRAAITIKFGGQKLTSDLCFKINALAEKWYNKFVSKKPMYVLNYAKK